MKRIFLIFMLVSSTLFAQDFELEEQGVHFIQNTKFRVHDNWSLDNMFQFRRVDFIENTQLFFVRPSANYLFGNGFTLGAGYWFLKFHNAGENGPLITQNEHRIYEHLTYKHNTTKLNFAHRIIFEQRHKQKIELSTDPPITFGRSYRQRLRYRILFSFNLFSFSNEKPVKFRIFEEVRFRFKGGFSEAEFDQNNLYGQLGYSFFKNSMLWSGWGVDYFKLSDHSSLKNNVLWFRLDYKVDLRKKKA